MFLTRLVRELGHYLRPEQHVNICVATEVDHVLCQALPVKPNVLPIQKLLYVGGLGTTRPLQRH